MPDPALRPSPAFGALLSPVGTGGGVTVVERDGLGLANVLARRGKATALRERIRKLHGLDLPQGPTIAHAGAVTFIGTGPGAWLAIHEDRGNHFAQDLIQDVADFAAIADQSDAYAVLQLSGEKVRETLSKGFAIDLHPSAFGANAAAVTAAAHMGAILWRHGGAEAAAPAFAIAVFRSYAGSFWHWLAESAAEFGLTVLPSGDAARS